MSWSIDGSIRRPIEVSALLQHTRAVLRELLAIDEVPELSSNAPMATIETAGTDITFTVCLPTGDGAEVDTLDAFFDENRGIVWPLIYDPREVIAKTGLAPGDLGFLDRCERYLRQFEHLNGWPRTVTLGA